MVYVSLLMLQCFMIGDMVVKIYKLSLGVLCKDHCVKRPILFFVFLFDIGDINGIINNRGKIKFVP